MEMEVMIPSPAGDFNFDSACTSPYISAPSSPRSFGNFFFSAPTSPTSFSSSFFCDSAAASGGDLPSTIPFKWEEKPGIPKTKRDNNEEIDNDFEFEFSGPLERASVSAADELFDGGKIKPLKPPPRLQFPDTALACSPKSPINKKGLRESLSPRHKKKDFDPFRAAMERACQENASQERGRERNYSTSSHRKKGSRSLSPFKVFDAFFESESNDQNSSGSSKTKSPSSSSSSSSSSFYKKWRLKDLLLFRSASEGRPTSKESLKKYSLLKRSVEEQEEVKNSSFRSTDSSGGGGSVSRRRGAAVSAHERHYTAKRAVAEEMRRKTVLPYRHGFLGCLGFSPVVQEISRGLGNLTRG